MLALDRLERAADQRGRLQPTQRRAPVVAPPRPGVAEPHLRQQVQRRRIRPVVGGRHHDGDVVGCSFRIGDRDVEEPVVGEDPGVGELELTVFARAPAVLGAQVRVRVLGLRIAIEQPHRRVGGRAVDRPPVLLDVLAVVALAVGETEQPFLEQRVAAVPHRQREVEESETVADAADAVLAPTVGTGVRLLEGQVVPGVAVGGVVLAHRAPLPPGQVRAPQAPGTGRVGRFGQPSVLRGQRRVPVVGGRRRMPPGHVVQPRRSRNSLPHRG